MKFFLPYKKMLLIITMVALSLVSSSQLPAKPYDPTEDIISAFCSGGLGPYTQTALNYSKSLSSIIASLKDNPACKNVYSTMLDFTSSLEVIERQQQEKTEYERMEFKVNDLEEQIQLERVRALEAFENSFRLENPHATDADVVEALRGFTPSTMLLTTLEDEFTRSRLGLTDAKISNEIFSKTNEREKRLENILRLRRHAEGVFATLNSATECTEAFPNLLGVIGAQVLAASSTIQGGVVGATMLSSGVIAAGVSDLVRNLRYDTKTKAIVNLRLPVAISCAVEGMAKTWCQARDTQSVLQHSKHFHVKTNQNEDPELANTYMGIEMLAQSLPVFIRWTQRISAGSSSGSEAQARRRVAALKLRFDLNSAINGIDGIINEASLKIANLRGTAEEIHKAEKLLLLSLLNELISTIEMLSQPSRGGDEGSGPFFNSFISDQMCGPRLFFYSNGTERVMVSTDDGFFNCNTYVNERFPQVQVNPPSISSLKNLTKTLSDEALIFVNQEIQLVLEENPALVLAQLDSVNPIFLKTPHDFLKESTTYLTVLKQHVSSQDYRYFVALIEKTLGILQKTREILDKRCEVTESNDCRSFAAQQLNELSLLLIPNSEILYISNTIREIVKQDVDLKLSTGKFEDQDLNLGPQISPENNLDIMIRQYMGIQSAFDDASRAKNIIEKNLILFGKLFAGPLFQRIKTLYKDLKKDKDNDDKKRELSLLCLQSTVLPKESGINNFFKRKLAAKYCKGAVYKSPYHESVPHLEFDAFNSRKNFRERACTLYDFRNKLRLFEMFDSKQ